LTGSFLDDEDAGSPLLFKLYPWEDLLRDDYADHIAGSGCLFLEHPHGRPLLPNNGAAARVLGWENVSRTTRNLLRRRFFEHDVG